MAPVVDNPLKVIEELEFVWAVPLRAEASSPPPETVAPHILGEAQGNRVSGLGLWGMTSTCLSFWRERSGSLCMEEVGRRLATRDSEIISIRDDFATWRELIQERWGFQASRENCPKARTLKEGGVTTPLSMDGDIIEFSAVRWSTDDLAPLNVGVLPGDWNTQEALQ
ncbi:hypothetical protein D9758_010203 [Tetrapyrgos nigripes]|uniref:Uncharacterized protein n=1 Tax=Tetrapyrgos nigripes TaxID=182062 RepID=A0A8H5CXK7_9AGAR|nr:hypothetical protein D9758_010203 [Tetrapyrgos nigripes]